MYKQITEVLRDLKAQGEDDRDSWFKGLQALQGAYRHIMSEDIRRGMEAKARRGGTIGRTRLGYLPMLGDSKRGRIETVIIVDQRVAPVIQRAFRQFATTPATIADIHTMLNNAKLTEQPLSRRRVRSILSDRYYLGVVIYQGTVYPGQHEALVDEALFVAVQAKLRPEDKVQGLVASQEVA